MPFLRAPIREQIPHLADLSLDSRNCTELGFAFPVHLPQMTSSHRRAIFQASHLWDTYKPSGFGEGKRSTFFPQRLETLTGVNFMTQSFEVGSLMSFGTDLVTWTSPRTSLFPHSVPLIPCMYGPRLVLYQTNCPSDLAQKEKKRAFRKQKRPPGMVVILKTFSVLHAIDNSFATARPQRHTILKLKVIWADKFWRWSQEVLGLNLASTH